MIGVMCACVHVNFGKCKRIFVFFVFVVLFKNQSPMHHVKSFVSSKKKKLKNYWDSTNRRGVSFSSKSCFEQNMTCLIIVYAYKTDLTPEMVLNQPKDSESQQKKLEIT